MDIVVFVDQYFKHFAFECIFQVTVYTTYTLFLFTSVFSKLKLYLSFYSICSQNIVIFGRGSGLPRRLMVPVKEATVKEQAAMIPSHHSSDSDCGLCTVLSLQQGQKKTLPSVLLPILLTNILAWQLEQSNFCIKYLLQNQYQPGRKYHFFILSQASHQHLNKIVCIVTVLRLGYIKLYIAEYVQLTASRRFGDTQHLKQNLSEVGTSGPECH